MAYLPRMSTTLDVPPQKQLAVETLKINEIFYSIQGVQGLHDLVGFEVVDGF